MLHSGPVPHRLGGHTGPRVRLRRRRNSLAEYFGLDDTQGVAVIKVLDNTPAKKAGFKEAIRRSKSRPIMRYFVEG